MKTLLFFLLLTPLISCSDNISSSEVKQSKTAQTNKSKNHNDANLKHIKKNKLDSLQELKLLIAKAYETHPSKWIKEGVIHPDLGLSISTTPRSDDLHL